MPPEGLGPIEFSHCSTKVPRETPQQVYLNDSFEGFYAKA